MPKFRDNGNPDVCEVVRCKKLSTYRLIEGCVPTLHRSVYVCDEHFAEINREGWEAQKQSRGGCT